MKTYGIVVDFDGLYGHIKAVDGQNYIVLDKEIMSKNLNKFDYVEFVPEYYNTVENNINIARFVKKLEKEFEEEQLKK